VNLQRASAEVVRARAALDRERAASAGWHDAARHKFDTRRLDPLCGTANQIVAALKRADHEIGKAF
jgi:hypothetical protein